MSTRQKNEQEKISPWFDFPVDSQESFAEDFLVSFRVVFFTGVTFLPLTQFFSTDLDFTERGENRVGHCDFFLDSSPGCEGDVSPIFSENQMILLSTQNEYISSW